jgi:hypothetical protein
MSWFSRFKSGSKDKPTVGEEEQHAAALKELRGRVDTLFRETEKPGKWGVIPTHFQQWCDDACLQRFLRANSWKPDASFNQLYETLGWRRDFGVENLTAKDIEKQLRLGNIYIQGKDKAGRPILYLKKHLDNAEEFDYNLYTKELVYLMEKAIRLMGPGVESWIWIVDLNGYCRADATPVDIARQIIHIMATCYPERLYKCVFVDAPMIFHGFWSLIKHFLDPVTKEKIVWVEGPATPGSKKQQTFLEWIDPNQLEVAYGGNLDYHYNYEKEEGQFDLANANNINTTAQPIPTR